MTPLSRNGFYDYMNRYMNRPKNIDPDASLKFKINAIFKEHRSRYGSRRIVKQLQIEGHQIGRHKTRRLMRELDLKVKISKRHNVTMR